MSVRRLVPVTLAAAVAASAVLGAAATLTTAGPQLGAGGAVVADCDTGGIAVAYVGAPGPVTAIQVTGLDARCDGGALQAMVDDGAGGNQASGMATVTGGGATVPLTPIRAAEAVARWRVVVVTP